MKLQETNDYWLLVDTESELKEGEYCFLHENHYVNGGLGKYNEAKAIGYGMDGDTNFFNKVIAHLSKKDTPELPGVWLLQPHSLFNTITKRVLSINEQGLYVKEDGSTIRVEAALTGNYTPYFELPKQEEDVEQLAKTHPTSSQYKENQYWWSEGYKAASGRGRWNEEDIIKAWDKFGDNHNRPPRTKKELLDSLKLLSPAPAVPVDFIPEYEDETYLAGNSSNPYDNKVLTRKKLKTVTTPEGKVILQGRWVYE